MSMVITRGHVIRRRMRIGWKSSSRIGGDRLKLHSQMLVINWPGKVLHATAKKSLEKEEINALILRRDGLGEHVVVILLQL